MSGIRFETTNFQDILQLHVAIGFGTSLKSMRDYSINGMDITLTLPPGQFATIDENVNSDLLLILCGRHTR